MDTLGRLIVQAVRVDSIWSIVVRAIIWLVFVSIFAVGVSRGKNFVRIKSEAGLFIGFIILTGISIYIAFGIIPTITTTPSS